MYIITILETMVQEVKSRQEVIEMKKQGIQFLYKKLA